jgi:signal transduction histidine kinase/CheY-like chemotaxis protein/HPt (histidine-containing phosphotransfer) domain-containing protein
VISEKNRIEALKSSLLLDTPSESSFDELARLASLICGCDYALISLIDSDRIWFKAKVGIHEAELPRQDSFCQEAIQQEGVFVVADTALDPRFSNHPWVSSKLGVRFYAGVALKDQEGYALGTLNVLDKRTLVLSFQQELALMALARQVMLLIEMRKTNTRLASAEKKSSELAESRFQFLARMSHEIRTPVHGIIGMAELLATKTLDSQATEFLETIQDSADNLLKLVDRVMDLSKLETGTTKLENEPFALKAMAVATLDLLRAHAAKHRTELVFVADEIVPDWVMGDAHQLRQVFLNLVGNAIKFTRNGTVTLRIKALDSHPEYPLLKFEVQDTGQGVSEKAKSQIFKAFYQGESPSTQNFGGAGLGLSICSGIVGLMGGQMQLESEEGKGSLFSFQTQMQKTTPKLSALTAGTRLDYTNLGSADKTLRLLIAEDNTINRKIYEGYLAGTSVEIVFAENGQVAVDAFSKGRFDLILMDCQMPVMDGFEASLRIRSLENSADRYVPIVAVTASTSEQYLLKSKNVGMDGHIQKPVSKSQLIELIEKWTARGQEGVFDLQVIRDLKTLGEQTHCDLLGEIVKMFIAEAPERLVNLQTSLALKDFQALGRWAHQFKSSCGALGMSRMIQICDQIEIQADTQDMRILEGLLLNFKAELERALEALEAGEISRAA